MELELEVKNNQGSASLAGPFIVESGTLSYTQSYQGSTAH
jgi:hypothetical protein